MFNKNPFLCIALLFLAFNSMASRALCQSNFLLNGNFEDINTCKEFSAECGVEGWFYLKDVKIQMMANEQRTDLIGANSFAIFYNWNSYTNFTPIIGTILPCNLQKGQQYIFKGWMNARLNSKLVLKPAVCIGTNFYVPLRPFAKEMKTDSIVQVKQVAETPFFKFEYSFTATGDERYLTFGTYVREDLESSKKKLLGAQTVTLILDNFSLTSTNPLETSCAGFDKNKQLIYQYDYRHKDMDYALYGKGKLPIELPEDKKDNLTRFKTPAPAQVKPDTLKLGDVLFDFNKAELKGSATKMLEAFFINSHDKRSIDSIYVEGHTDSVGSDTTNLVLSQQRSEAVVKWLTDSNILNANGITVHAFGRSRPITSNKTPAGRALNRRVEVIVFRKL